ncbi:serine hydrolase [uncultured Thiothrix sp.]|jgi:CubicO group peptidase (beta-lactamase class C family)|uniref:serine hydrolase domain-containing protein n=1 Tax=uncultured Thiothrix sp. TaxID=223185 RepID=UPI00260A059B|nr:serine hydrolase domain-containing protein [uncultured Thiothrix sp.]HMT91485.1 serine hydrolase domain-containing protein [Thiolinea sp.]
MLTNILLLILATGFAGGFYLRYRLRTLKDRGNLAAAIDQEFHKVTKRHQCGGLVLGVYKSGKTLFKSYGSVNAANPHLPNAQAIFQIGSVSKVFTGVTLQILCDEGIVSLDDNLEQLIGHKIPLAAAIKPITLRQLATHTSGFPRVPKILLEQLEAKVGKQHLLDNPYNETALADIYAYLQKPSDLGKAGDFFYSNYGMGLLGHILEQATGQSLETLVQEKIFQPLQMQHSGINLNKENPTQIMQGYTANGELAQVWTFQVLAGAGAFYSTAEDMLQFIQANLSKDNPLMHSLQKTHLPQASGKTGIAWMQASGLDRFIGNQHTIWHDGQVGGFTAYLGFDPKQDCGLVVLSSRSISINMLGMMVMRQLRSQSWAS